jgi:DNA repair photolyase
VNLKPEMVHTLVLWSKNFGKFLACDRAFSPYRLYFLFTLNDMPELEPSLPALDTRLGQMRFLAARYSPGQIGWRFDPLVFRESGPFTDIDRFSYLAEKIAETGVRRLIISFLDFYRKVQSRNASLRLGIVEPSDEMKRSHAAALTKVARSFGFTVESCCDDLAGVDGIRPSSCIDGALFAELAGEPARLTKDTGQRPSCRCTASRDIGSYRDMPCSSGCFYCYANPIIPSCGETFR